MHQSLHKKITRAFFGIAAKSKEPCRFSQRYIATCDKQMLRY